MSFSRYGGDYGDHKRKHRRRKDRHDKSTNSHDKTTTGSESC